MMKNYAAEVLLLLFADVKSDNTALLVLAILYQKKITVNGMQIITIYQCDLPQIEQIKILFKPFFSSVKWCVDVRNFI